ncbi:SRPBCC domain-containing protein [Micromonospora sp. NPDC005806]|uniref:SRPBCC family protein n=1 Tax=Micromonospora sp. NPDC005806 TaxID=3364234 RepID=UPI0036B9BDEC
MTERAAVEVDQFLAHPPAKVWRALTDSDLLARWLMPNDFRPLPGHRFTFRTTPRPGQGFDGIVHCEVLELDEPHRLRWAWRGGRLDTVVTW